MAEDIIVGWSVEEVSKAKDMDFEALDPEELAATLSDPSWNTWTITIETTHPDWVEHLPSLLPFNGRIAVYGLDAMITFV